MSVLWLTVILCFLSNVGTQFSDESLENDDASDNVNITILGMFPYVTTDVYFQEYIPGEVLQASVEIALKAISKTDDLLTGYSLNLKPVNSKCDNDGGNAAFYFAEEALRPNSPVVVLGPKCDDPTILIGEMVNPDNSVITVSYGARTVTLNSSNKNKRFFRTVSPSSELNKVVYGLLVKFEWETICIAIQGLNEYLRQAEHFTAYLQEKSMNFTILHFVTERNTDFLVNSYCRIFVVFADNWVHPWISCEMHRANLTGEHIVSIYVGFFLEQVPWLNSFTDCPLNLSESAPSSLSVHFGESILLTDSDQTVESNYQHMKHGKDFENELLAELYNYYGENDYLYYYNLEIAAAAYDATWAIALALNASIESLAMENLTLEDYLPRSSSHVSDLIVEQFESLSFQGVYKTVDFTDTRHYPFDKVIISQFQNNTFNPVATYNSASEEILMLENETFIWIGKTVPSDQPFVVTRELSLALLTLPICGLVLCLFFFVFNCYFRNRTIIKASSPHINNIVIFGCIMIFLSIASYIFVANSILSEITRTWLCNFTLWFVFCGFTLAFGSLAVKTWRVYRIFQNPWSKRRLYKDSSLYCIIAAMLGIDVFVLLLMSAISPLYATEFLIETRQYTYKYPICDSSNYSEIFTDSLLLYKVLIVAVAGFLALQTRKIKSKAFNDSKWISITIYLVVLSTMLGCPVAVISVFSGQITLGFLSIIVLLCVFGFNILLTVFVPKIFALIQARNEKNTKMVVTSAEHTTQTAYRGARRTSEYYRPKYNNDGMTRRESTSVLLMHLDPQMQESDIITAE